MDCTVTDSGFDSDHTKVSIELSKSSELNNGDSSVFLELNLSSDDDDIEEFCQETSASLRSSQELLKHKANETRVSRSILYHSPGVISNQPSSKLHSTPRDRLTVTSKSNGIAGDQQAEQPLVAIDIDESDNQCLPRSMTHNFSTNQLQRSVTQISNNQMQRGVNKQLLESDDDLDIDLDYRDLTVPRTLTERCICCSTRFNCGIQ